MRSKSKDGWVMWYKSSGAKETESFQGKDVIAITTGGNVDDEMFMRALQQKDAL